MADLAANNPPSPPHTQPRLIPLPMPLHQLPSPYVHASCMVQISPFFPRLCLDLFKHPSIFPQGFTPPPGGFASMTPCAATNSHGGCGFYGSGAGSCFVGPYQCLYVPPIQLQLKVPGRLQSGTSTNQRRGRHIRNSSSQQRKVEPESRGTGVFHPPNMNQGPRYKKRRRRRCGKRNEINGRVEERGEGSTGTSGEALLADQAEYDVLLPSEWPY